MAKFDFLNLDDTARNLMLLEIEHDINNQQLYISDRLNEIGRNNYHSYLVRSVKESDEAFFESLLDLNTHFNQSYLRQAKEVKMPSNASTLLCQSEFNRYYIRAICQRAINDGIETVEIYRARESSWTRPESEAKIGTTISAIDLLNDLRTSVGKESQLFPEINSGLCVKI